MTIEREQLAYVATQDGERTVGTNRAYVIDEAITKAFGVCPECMGEGQHEVTGDGDNFEVDVIKHKPCSSCDGSGKYENNN